MTRMTLEEVSSFVYQEVIPKPYHVFARASFHQLNQSKAEKTYYLLLKDSKYRLGLTAAKINEKLLSPYSAPFGGFVPVADNCKIQYMEEAVELVEQWAIGKGVSKIQVTFPPAIYYQSYLAKFSNVLFRAEFETEKIELNFHFDLSNLTNGYTSRMWPNAKKNLAIGLSGDLTFSRCEKEHEKELAYKILQQNRLLIGGTLAMTLDQIHDTSKIIPADFFLVNTAEQDIAAAIVFHVAPTIVQIVYWGDLPDFQHLKTMNFLSYRIFEYYKEKGFRIVDVGTANFGSEPNYGLVEFKESLGCDIQSKVTLIKKIGS